mmetsp:Transcript_66051/g.123198  ORF Transcript_66051/g.123198 Transcript_66051/m.123198 type:complete len:257 (-) Transcript_66051:149-919(-)
MQATKYIPNEITGKKGKRPNDSSSLGKDYAFADEALTEKHSLLTKTVITTSGSAWNDILYHTSDHQWVLSIWSVELSWMVSIITIFSMEMWGSCPQLPHSMACQFCHSEIFFAWNMAVVFLWFLSFGVYVILVSRGFKMTVRRLGSVVADARAMGIAVFPVHLFLLFSSLLLLVLVIGISVLVRTSDCWKDGDRIDHSAGWPRPLSPLMFWTTLLTMIFVPVLLVLGRCVDVIEMGLLCLAYVASFVETQPYSEQY